VPVLPMGRSSPPHRGGLGIAQEHRPAVRLRARRWREVTLGVKKVVAWLVIAFVVFYVVKQPDDSARLVRDAGHALGDAASSLSTFVGSIF
jgi:hypothetical protein